MCAAEGEPWRVEPDPHFPAWKWRCAALVLQWRYGVIGVLEAWRPIDPTRATDPNYIGYPTPERQALWLDLFLHP